MKPEASTFQAATAVQKPKNPKHLIKKSSLQDEKLVIIDDPKAKPQRMQTLGRSNNRDKSPTLKSKDILQQMDQESLSSGKFHRNFLTSKKKVSAHGVVSESINF